MDTKKEYFVIRFQHMRISDRLRNDLSETAINMGHPAISSLRKQGQTLWDEQSLTLKQNYEDLEKSIASLDKRIQSLQNQNAQLNSQLKKIEIGNRSTPSPQSLSAAENNQNGALIALFLGLSLIALAIGQMFNSPADLIGNIGGFASIGICLFLIPGWRQKRLAKSIRARANVEGSQENLRKESHELAQQIQSGQNAQDELQRRMDHTKEALLHPYV